MFPAVARPGAFLPLCRPGRCVSPGSFGRWSGRRSGCWYRPVVRQRAAAAVAAGASAQPWGRRCMGRRHRLRRDWRRRDWRWRDGRRREQRLGRWRCCWRWRGRRDRRGRDGRQRNFSLLRAYNHIRSRGRHRGWRLDLLNRRRRHVGSGRRCRSRFGWCNGHLGRRELRRRRRSERRFRRPFLHDEFHWHRLRHTRRRRGRRLQEQADQNGQMQAQRKQE